MANIFERLRDWLLAPLLGDSYVKRTEFVMQRRQYRKGIQALPLTTAEDNIITNFVGLIVDRAVSMLFGKPVTFSFESQESSDYIEKVWLSNRQGRVLKSLATYGAEAGTCYIKILPDVITAADGTQVPKLQPLDPIMIEMTTKSDDYEEVTTYTLTWVQRAGDDEVAYKQVIERVEGATAAPAGEQEIQAAAEQTPEYSQEYHWSISTYHAEKERWVLDSQQAWEYPFAPVVHWQNLPENGQPYGRPDITNDVILLQDKLNFIISNTAKIIKYHAHPKTWGRMFGVGTNAIWGVDDMLLSENPEATLQNLEMNSDLGSSLNFIKFLRQALFDIVRSVDIDSLADKLGALTNFGLRVLYQDAISKLEDKRSAYGEALSEINHRLLVLAGMPDDDGGEVVWEDALPVNEKEVAEAIKSDLSLGLVSKETASKLRGYDWEAEKPLIEEDAKSNTSIGAAIMEAFSKGDLQGSSMQQAKPPAPMQPEAEPIIE